jgi:hypothetical protein
MSFLNLKSGIGRIACKLACNLPAKLYALLDETAWRHCGRNYYCEPILAAHHKRLERDSPSYVPYINLFLKTACSFQLGTIPSFMDTRHSDAKVLVGFRKSI